MTGDPSITVVVDDAVTVDVDVNVLIIDGTGWVLRIQGDPDGLERLAVLIARQMLP